MTVLVLTEDFDPTADMVIDQLNRRGVPVLRCDTSWFPSRLAVDAELVEGQWVGNLRTANRHVRVGDVRSIWYRRPTAFTFGGQLTAAERRYCAYEAKFGLGGVLWSLPALWVNHPAMQADLYKPLQLTVAARCGLHVPDTLTTNRPDRVREFAADHPGGVVVKPLGFSSTTEDGTRAMIYTHLLTSDDLGDLAGVEQTMHTFQAYVDKAYEVRLTVVGRRMFAARIDAGSQAALIDFRADYPSVRLRVTDVPEPVAAGVAAFLDHFGLAFGACDFAVDHAGTWWMLECNGGGQYAFVEQATGLPISAAIADLLEKGHL